MEGSDLLPQSGLLGPGWASSMPAAMGDFQGRWVLGFHSLLKEGLSTSRRGRQERVIFPFQLGKWS